MNSSTDSLSSTVIGLDIGSSYIKAVSIPLCGISQDNAILEKYQQRTGYLYNQSAASILSCFAVKPSLLGLTGYGKEQWEKLPGVAHRTEISALAQAIKALHISDGTLVDIGGQDSKVLIFKNHTLIEHAMNRRCAAGTGSYLEFIAHKMNLDLQNMNQLAAQEKTYYPINSFCTVFASTEILDCIKKNIPLSQLVRGLYISIAQRVREIATLQPPVYLAGGLVAFHPVLLDIFSSILGMQTYVVPNPQFLAAWGIALYAREKLDHHITFTGESS